jgi:plastocyanin
MPERRRFLRSAAALPATLLVALPFSLSALGQAQAQARPQEPAAQVEIRDFRFQPASVTVKVGTTLRWVNREKRTPHTVRFAATAGAPVIESDLLFPDDFWERRFDRAGRYPYECGPHPEMKGEVIVVD